MISICLPTYNRLTYLKPCLESVLDKFGSYPYEVVIADGGSTDGTLEYLHDLDHENIKLIEQGKLVGAVKACNACFKKAEGDYLFIANDDAVMIPKVLTKACKLMDKDEQVGLISPKDQEVTRANVHGVTLSRIRRYWILLGKFNLIRDSIMKKNNYFDEKFSTYFVDDDTFLTVMKQGYTTMFTKEVGNIHYRLEDSKINIAKSRNEDEKTTSMEREHLLQKWGKLEQNLKEYLKKSYFKKRKAVLFDMVCDRIYESKRVRPFVERNQKISLQFYDWCLDKAIMFKDKKYDDMNDFFLPQKYPEDILASIK